MPGGNRRLPLRVLVALGVSYALVAAEPGSADEAIPLTLAEALARADRDSPELAAARERAAAQGERAEGAARSRWPRLAAASDLWRSDNPARVFAGKLNRGDFGAEDLALDNLNHPASLSHLTTALAVDLPLDVFGRLGLRTDAERATARSFEAAAEEARQEARLRVVEAFERAVLAQAALRVGESALEGARSREADFASRVEQGTALHADWLRARARRRQREAELAGSREQRSVALALLARAVGAPPGALFAPQGSASLPGSEGTLEEWQQRAAAGRGATRAAHERRASAEAALAGERRSRYPELGAYARLEDDRGSSSSAGSYTVGGSLRWSLFDAGRGRRIAAAEAEARAVGSESRAAADQVRLEVEAAWRRLLGARERHDAAQGGAEEGREALRVVQERRQAGMATLTDELETETVARSAELEELATAAEVVVAEAALRRAAGSL
jgi:outer membrane protein TolC